MELTEAQDAVESHLVNIHKLSDRATAAEESAAEASERAHVLESQAKAALLESIEMQRRINDEKNARKETLEELAAVRATSDAIIAKVEGRLGEVEGEHRKTMEELAGREAKLAAADSSIATLQAEHAALKDEARRCWEDLERSRGEVSEKEGLLAEALSRGADLERQMGDAQRAADRDRATVEAKEAELRRLTAAAEEQGGVLSEQQATIARRDEELAAVRDEMARRAKEHGEVVAEKDALLATRAQELAEAQGAARDKGEEVVKMQGVLEGTRESLHRLQREHEEALGELAGRESVVAERGSELEKLREDHSRTVAERDEMLAGKEEEVRVLRAEVGEKAGALAAVESAAAESQERAEELARHVCDLQQQCAEQAMLQARVASARDAVAQARQERDALVQERDALLSLLTSIREVHGANAERGAAARKAVASFVLGLEEDAAAMRELLSELRDDWVCSIRATGERRAEVCACVTAMITALQGTQVELTNALEFTTQALQDDAECRLFFELGKSMCDEVEATLDNLQISVRRVKDEARLRSETAQLLQAPDDSPHTDTSQDTWRNKVEELEAHLQLAWEQQSKAKEAYDMQIARLEDELAEAAVLLQATITGPADDSCGADRGGVGSPREQAAGPGYRHEQSREEAAHETAEQPDAARGALAHLEEITSLHEKLATQHARILELEERALKARTAPPSGAEAGAPPSAAVELGEAQALNGARAGSAGARAGEEVSFNQCCDGQCEHEEELTEVRDELVRLCASLQGHDGLGWDEEEG